MIDKSRLPNFIIAGAMKAGTSSMHHILNHHDNVFIAESEIFFFDLDDPQQHPDFFIGNRETWTFRDFDCHFNDYLGWYHSFFQGAIDGQVIGEDSTTYMASSKAAPRIAKLLPEVKLIFMLRDPVSRAYSQYCHLVRTGRAIYDFETALRHTPDTILQRGYYKEQIERFQHYFSNDQLKFILFEEFTQNTQKIVDEVCDFLGLETSVETRAVDTHQHRGTAPRSLGLKLTANWINRRAVEQIYWDHLPSTELTSKPSSIGTFLKHVSPPVLLSKVANLIPRSKYPPMSKQVREFLEKLYAKENAGLGDLIRIDIEQHWPYMTHSCRRI